MITGRKIAGVMLYIMGNIYVEDSVFFIFKIRGFNDNNSNCIIITNVYWPITKFKASY